LSNPYEPPKAPLETSQTRHGFRWRLIPSALLVLFGTLLVLMTLISIVLEVVRSWIITGGSGFFARTPLMLVMGTAGGLWIVSGAMFWKRRRWIAVVFLVVGYAVGCFAAMQMEAAPLPFRAPVAR
jgi:hypothetical protein